MGMYRNDLLRAGVAHLREFGYPHCDSSNITTDMVYRRFFQSMLEGTIEDKRASDLVKNDCRQLLEEINKAGEGA